MYMKELLLGTIIIAGLFSSAYAKDKEVVGEVTMGSFWWGTFASSPSTRKWSQSISMTG